MMHYSRYDDPNFIDAFLADLNLQEGENPRKESSNHKQQNRELRDEIAEQAPELKSSGGTITPALVSAASSPPSGLRAPPPTPESVAVKTTEHAHLPAIDEDEHGNQAQALLAQGQGPSDSQFRPTACEFEPAPTITHESLRSELMSHTTVTESIKNDTSDTLHQFREQAEARIALRGSSQGPQKAYDAEPGLVVNSDSHLSGATGTSDSPVIKIEEPSDDGRDHNDATTTSEPFPDMQDDSTAIAHSSDDDDSSINIIVDAPRSPDSFDSKKSIIRIASPEKASSQGIEVAANPFNRPALTEDSKSIKKESREDADFFASWGTPSTRSTPPARVRKIVVSNLPPSADYTLVQSLVHGGSLEMMFLTPVSAGPVTAYVLFNNADACEAYFKAYPNGLAFKHQGKKHVALIDQGTDVDVISGKVQSYVDCGATRVVKVTNADEEWSMRALHRIAEGRNDYRKVEAILDTYRDDSRTITFRFVSITDAVAFRRTLLRSPDWQDSDIQFALDPCEKATAIHQE